MKRTSILILFLLFICGALCAKPIAPPEFDTPDKRLYFFVCNGDIKGIDAALAEGADLNSVEKVLDLNRKVDSTYLPLHISIFKDDHEVFDHLLKKGADIHTFSDFGNCNALSLATIYDRREIILKLLDAGADPNASQKAPFMKEYSAIAYAALYGNVDLLKLFASRGGDLEKPLSWPMWRDSSPEFPLLVVAAQHGGVDVVRYLVEERGHAVNATEELPGLAPLSVAVRYNNLKVAKYLISKGANVNSVELDYYYWDYLTRYEAHWLSPLGVAARYGRVDMVKLLFAHGAKIRENVKENQHPMYWADRAGYYKVIEAFEAGGYASDYWSVIERQFRAGKSDEESALPVESASEYTPTFLKGHTRQWEVADEADLNTPLRLAVIADEQSTEVADLLTVALSGKTHLELIERSALDEVLREQALNRAGLTNGVDLSLVSGLLDAQALVLIETLTVNNKQVYQLRLVNSILGLQFGRHFIEKEAVLMNKTIEQYAGTLSALTNNFRRNYEKAIPVSLVNVRSDLGTVEGLKIENSLKQLLELQFLGQPSVLLTQREDLETLIREKDLGGREEEIKASSLFIDVGVELDAISQQIVGYTVRVEPAIGESFTLDLVAEGKPLNDAAVHICRSVMERIEVVYAETKSVQEGTLSRDGETYFNEGMWYFNLEEYEPCIERMRTAISLGYNKRAVWDYYFRAVELLIEDHRDHRGNDAANRLVLALERERLIALEGVLKLYRADGATWEDLHSPQFGLKGFHRQYMGGFFATFERFRPVAMQRRYSNELTDLERQYILLIKDYIAPCYGQPKAHGMYPFRGGTRVFFMTVDLMSQLEESEYEAALEGLMNASSKRGSKSLPGPVSLFHVSGGPPPVAASRWESVARKYLNERATFTRSLKKLQGVYAYNFASDRTPDVPISVSEREALASYVEQSISRIEEDDEFSEVDTLHRKIYFEFAFGLQARGLDRPSDWLTREGMVPRTFRINSEELEIWEIQHAKLRNLPELLGHAENYNFFKSISMALEAFEAAYASGQLRQGKYNENKIEELKKRRGILASGSLGTEAKDVIFADLPIRLWNPEQYGVPEFVSGSRLLNSPILKDGRWWVLAAVNRGSGTRLGNPRYALLEINPETLETQARWFEEPPLARASFGEVKLHGNWMAYMSNGNPISLINIETLESRKIPGFVPALTIMAAVDQWFFFTVQPDREEPGEWRSKPDMQIMLRYNLESHESEIVYNTRRNPPETPIDGTGAVFRFGGITLSPDSEAIFMQEDAYSPRHRIDCRTLEIRKSRGNEWRAAKSKPLDNFDRTVKNNSDVLSLVWTTRPSLKELVSHQGGVIFFTGKFDGTNLLNKGVIPKPSKEDPYYAIYDSSTLLNKDGRSRVGPTLLRPRLDSDEGGYGYINLSSHTRPNSILLGIFKMSDLADALKESTSFKYE